MADARETGTVLCWEIRGPRMIVDVRVIFTCSSSIILHRIGGKRKTKARTAETSCTELQCGEQEKYV
jgi:hypothetical protein